MTELLAGLGSVEHNFVGPQGTDTVEVYLKRSTLEAGAQLRQHQHTYAHVGMLVQGEVAVRAGVDDVWLCYVAPAVILMPANVPHEVCAGSSAVWYCVHATGEGDETKVDDALIAHP